MKHELWVDNEGLDSFCLAGKHGDDQRGLLEPGAKLVWSCEAESYFVAMTKYYKFRKYGRYTTNYPEHDKKTYQKLGWKE